MKVRGERECRACGTRWSYYETGSVECPSCGSLRSVGVAERKQHTDGGGDLDLSGARRAAGDEPVRSAASVAEDECRDYLTARGFVSGGDLLDLDDVYVAAQELKHAASIVASRLSVDDEIERYLLTLVRGAADGERPAADEIPREVRSARGLGAAAAVRAYLDDVRAYLDDVRAYVDDPDTDTPDDALRFVERLRDHEKRVQALDGDVPPETADRLVDAANAVGAYVRDGSDDAQERAVAALEELSS